MNAVVRALFDDAAITGAQAAGLKDTSTAAMQAAVREWFELFFMREAVKGKEEDPAQRIPYTITNKLTKACFAEYDSSFTENGTGKTAWLDGQRSLIDAEKQDVLQWVMVGGEGFLKPAPDGTGRLAYHVVRRDCYNVLARGPRGITDVLMSERSRAGSDYYTLLERRTVDGSGYLTIRYNLYVSENSSTLGHEVITDVLMSERSRAGSDYYTLLERRTVDGSGYLTIRYKLYVSENSSTLGHEVRLDSLPQYAALAPEHTYSVPFGGLGMTYIRLPMANNVDGSPDGVSVYEGAVQLIHNIYKNEYQLGREFELGRSRIVANADKLVTPDPEGGVMRLKDDVFVGLDGDTNDKGLTIFSPALRDESFERRKQSYLKACENIIGLKRGILSDVEAVERTAKEISRSEGDYSLSIMDLQRMWYDALMETLRITNLWGQALGLCDARAVDLEQLLSVSWGNGVLYDADKDWADTLSMVEAGLLKPELALAKKYDLPCETPEDLAAIREKYMPEMVQLTAQAGLR
ncbi:hypothetical protein DW194_15090 [Subdoligranulum sp. AM16-9]|nr:hypothetical protein DW194_15090 [Subdoligranulum sp. AM16-9]